MNKVIFPLLSLAIFSAPARLSAQLDTAEVVDLPGFSFKYSTETSASKSTIWRLWTDVDNWKKFDTSLEYSYLVEDSDREAGFAEGAVGYLKAEGAPRTRFKIVNVDTPDSFVVRLYLPLYQTIDQQRYFEVNVSGGTTFTHEINFKGALSPIFYTLLSRIYKKETRLVVERLKAVAETEEN